MNEQHKWLIEMFKKNNPFNAYRKVNWQHLRNLLTTTTKKKTIHKLQFKLQQKSDGKFIIFRATGISLVWSLNRKRFSAVFSVGE